MAALREGNHVPNVKFMAHTGEQVSLQSYQGRKAVVVYFYPKDYTPICTREACTFRDAFEDFVETGAVVIGISSDSNQSHHSFAQSHRLPFLLASDVNSSIRKAFGVPKMMGLFPGRVTYVIDKQGVVRHVFNAPFLADQHAKEALNAVRALV